MSNIFRFLTDDGLVGNASNQEITGAADIHWTGPPSGEIWDIYRILVNIRDSGSVNNDTFGALSALSNGCLLSVRRGGPTGTVTIDLLDGHTIKNNGDWSHYCYDMNISSISAGDKQVTARWTFTKGGKPIRLTGGLNEKLVIQTQDDTTGLVEFSIMAQGIKV